MWAGSTWTCPHVVTYSGPVGRRGQLEGEVGNERNAQTSKDHRAGDNTGLRVLIFAVWCFGLQTSILHIITDSRRWRVAYFSAAVAGRFIENRHSHEEGERIFVPRVVKGPKFISVSAFGPFLKNRHSLKEENVPPLTVTGWKLIFFYFFPSPFLLNGSCEQTCMPLTFA